jgi:uncharacterized membrane protein YsdA (DUF1294 family)
MALDVEDKRKLHAAVNQIDNQRLWLTTLAITFLGTSMGLWIGKTPVSGHDARLTFVFSILLITVLFLVFLYSHFLKRMLRTFTTYLILLEASDWERDRRAYRARFRTNVEWHERAQAIIFLFLGACAAGFPVAVLYLNQMEPPALWFGAEMATAAVYVLVVSGFGFCNWGDQEREIELQWRQIISEQASSVKD